MIVEKYKSAVLLKGGHLRGDNLVETLCLLDGTLVTYSQKRISDIKTHTLSAAITAWMSKSYGKEKSVSKALNYIRDTMENAVTINGLNCINHNPQ